PLFTFQIDFVRCLWVVLPAACVWGASFPLALAAVGSAERDPARLVGTVYAANTIGGIVGALLGSLLIIAWLGTRMSQRLLIVAAALSAAIMLGAAMDVQGDRRTARRRGFSWGFVAAALAVLLVAAVPEVPPLLVGYGRWFATRLDNADDFIYVGEGMTASVAV